MTDSGRTAVLDQASAVHTSHAFALARRGDLSSAVETAEAGRSFALREALALDPTTLDAEIDRMTPEYRSYQAASAEPRAAEAAVRGPRPAPSRATAQQEGVRLTFLSACQSGVTDILTRRDEVIGLPSACIQSGASGVVATLWPVDDAALGSVSAEAGALREAVGSQGPCALALSLVRGVDSGRSCGRVAKPPMHATCRPKPGYRLVGPAMHALDDSTSP